MEYVVTGAASGIGKATALKLLSSGHDLIVVDLPGSNFDFLSNTKVEIVYADVSKQNDRNQIIAASNGVNGLVNAAGKIETKNVSDYSIADCGWFRKLVGERHFTFETKVFLFTNATYRFYFFNYCRRNRICWK